MVNNQCDIVKEWREYMKKVIKKIALLLIVFGIGVGVTLLYTNNKYKVYEEEETKQIKKHVDTISMMLETEAGSGNK